MSARNRLADGIRAVHQEAGGVLGLDIVRRRDARDLVVSAAAGDTHAAMVLRAVKDTLAKIQSAPRRRPMLCVCCPRSLLKHDFAVVLASPEREDRQQGLALAVCTTCATSVPEITAKVAVALREIWPDLRQVTITNEAGHA